MSSRKTFCVLVVGDGWLLTVGEELNPKKQARVIQLIGDHGISYGKVFVVQLCGAVVANPTCCPSFLSRQVCFLTHTSWP